LKRRSPAKDAASEGFLGGANKGLESEKEAAWERCGRCVNVH
jgi:hypothetical protein